MKNSLSAVILSLAALISSLAILAGCQTSDVNGMTQANPPSFGSFISPQIPLGDRQKILNIVSRWPQSLRGTLTKNTNFFLIETDDDGELKVYVNRPDLRGALEPFMTVAGKPDQAVGPGGQIVYVPNFPPPTNEGHLPPESLPTISGGYERRLVSDPGLIETGTLFQDLHGTAMSGEGLWMYQGGWSSQWKDEFEAGLAFDVEHPYPSWTVYVKTWNNPNYYFVNEAAPPNGSVFSTPAPYIVPGSWNPYYLFFQFHYFTFSNCINGKTCVEFVSSACQGNYYVGGSYLCGNGSTGVPAFSDDIIWNMTTSQAGGWGGKCAACLSQLALSVVNPKSDGGFLQAIWPNAEIATYPDPGGLRIGPEEEWSSSNTLGCQNYPAWPVKYPACGLSQQMPPLPVIYVTSEGNGNGFQYDQGYVVVND